MILYVLDERSVRGRPTGTEMELSYFARSVECEKSTFPKIYGTNYS